MALVIAVGSLVFLAIQEPFPLVNSILNFLWEPPFTLPAQWFGRRPPSSPEPQGRAPSHILPAWLQRPGVSQALSGPGELPFRVRLQQPSCSSLSVNELPPGDSRAKPEGLVTSSEPCDKLHPEPASEILGIHFSSPFTLCSGRFGLGLEPTVSLTALATLRVGEE